MGWTTRYVQFLLVLIEADDHKDEVDEYEGERVADLCEDCALSPEQLARLLGVSPSGVHRWKTKKNRKRPTEMARRLMWVLDKVRVSEDEMAVVRQALIERIDRETAYLDPEGE